MSPIAKKLQIKSGKSWLFYNVPANYLALLEPLPEDTKIGFALDGNFDGIQLFVVNNDELTNSLKMIIPLLKPDTIFWICYPKKSSGVKSDLEMMGSWDAVTKYGLSVVTAAAINATWTALRFKPEGKSKTSDTKNAAIHVNEYAGYIDIERKQVTLPNDMQQVLAQSPIAMAFYQDLSYSNKKEYVLWILSAKQEKTKAERLTRLTEKLLAKKKNPTEK
jgi:hypothetical protein